MVSLGEYKQNDGDGFFEHFCGGALVMSDLRVLSASHYFTINSNAVHDENSSELRIVVGTNHISGDSDVYEVTCVIQRDHHYVYNGENDLALA